MRKLLWIITFILIQISVSAQSREDGGTKGGNFHSKEANKVIETRGSRVKANTKKHTKSKAEEQKMLKKKKKVRRKKTKNGNFGFY